MPQRKQPYNLFAANACLLYYMVLNKSDLRSLDFVVDQLFVKLFKTTNIQIVRECQKNFGLELPSVILDKRCSKFISKYNACLMCHGLNV